MSSGVTATVYIDGARVADGSAGDNPEDPTVLSGLSITWGRETTVDQPQGSTCQLTLQDQPGGGTFLELLRTGSTLDVYAEGTIYTDPSSSTITDPTFDTTPVGATPTNVTTTNAVATVGAFGGGQGLRVDAVDASAAPQVTIAPAAFDASPAAWDFIPKLTSGQVWGISATVQATAGATITLQAVAYQTPAGTNVTQLDTPVTVTATGAPQTLTKRLPATVSGVWVGVRVKAYPPGPSWAKVPAATRWVDAPGAWRDYSVVWVDDVMVKAPAGGTTREVLVFSGRITDVEAGWDEALDGPALEVTAVDFTADLDNVRVGDEPWSVEPMADRFNRILTLAGINIEAVIDPAPGAVLVSYQDVDSQAATGLLQDLAQSVDAVMWSAAHPTTGPYIHVENTARRPALFVLTADPDTGIVEIVVGPTDTGLSVSACDVLREPVKWLQNVSDLATRVAVTWLEQGVDDKGQPATTDRTYTVIDAPLETEHGQRGISVSTLLQSEADAANVANAMLARGSVTGWRATGLTIEDAVMTTDGNPATTLLLQLLDGTFRNGAGIYLTDLPAWSPAGDTVPGYLEGGKYSHEEGQWILELTVSRGGSQGHSVEWAELDEEWAWADFDTDIAWTDLYGVGPDPEVSA